MAKTQLGFTSQPYHHYQKRQINNSNSVTNKTLGPVFDYFSYLWFECLMNWCMLRKREPLTQTKLHMGGIQSMARFFAQTFKSPTFGCNLLSQAASCLWGLLWRQSLETIRQKSVIFAGCFHDHVWVCSPHDNVHVGWPPSLQRGSNMSSLKSTTLNPLLSFFFQRGRFCCQATLGQSFQLSHFDLDGVRCHCVQTVSTNSELAFCAEMKDKMCTKDTSLRSLSNCFFLENDFISWWHVVCELLLEKKSTAVVRIYFEILPCLTPAWRSLS